MSTTTPRSRTKNDEAQHGGASAGRKKILLLIAAVLIAGGAAYWFLLRPSPEPEKPEPGEVVALEAVQVNLQKGHYLRIGIALQLSLEVAEEVDGSKALDALIEIYFGDDIEDLAEAEHCEQLREDMVERVAELYEGEVLDVCVTEFVTQ